MAHFRALGGLSPIGQLGQAPPLDGHGAGSRPCGGARSGMRPHTCTRQPPMCFTLPSFGLRVSRPAWRLKNGHNSMPRFGANISLEFATVPALGLAVAPEVACGFTHALGMHPNPPHPLAPVRVPTPRLGAHPPCHLATPPQVDLTLASAQTANHQWKAQHLVACPPTCTQSPGELAVPVVACGGGVWGLRLELGQEPT